MRRWVIVLSCIFLALQGAGAAYAADQPALQMQPLQYVEQLQPGERKRGFADITNIRPEPIEVGLSVQGFRQTDNKGDLTFFDDPRLQQGIQLDLHDAQIPARKTLRLYFVVDGSKLPSGDVFAAIFAQVMNSRSGAGDPSVRLGTLLMLTNGTPGARQAAVTSLDMGWLQAGAGLDGTLAIKNTASPQTASGFFPDVQLQVWPFGPTTTLHGPLVYAGNTRTVSFRLDGNYFGVYKITGAYKGDGQSRWIVAVTGYWQWLAPLIVVILAGILMWFLQRSQHGHRFAHKR